MGNGRALVNAQPQMKHIDMLAEIIISSELSKLSSTSNSPPVVAIPPTTEVDNNQDTVTDFRAPGFLSVLGCYLTEGRYPNDLLAKWDDYHQEKVSENDRPDESLFGQDDNDQQFVVLELKNSGEDLEGVTLTNASQGWAIFQQVAHALAIAEKLLAFEHRDLHWGNVLIQTCTEKHILFGHASETFKVETQGVRATIIDFSLSRLSLPTDTDDVDNIIYNNLTEDPDLFKSEGDYQFDIYRMMRSHTNNEWEKFHPKTNVMWLHYMLDKLTGEVLYKNKKSKAHASALGKMRHVKNSFLQFDSAYAYVTATSTSASAKGSTTPIE